jgi:Prolyl oligopeptidase family
MRRRTSWGRQVVCLLAALSPALVPASEIIDRFAAVESVWAARVSPDGKHIALGCSRHGARAACVFELDAVGKPPIIYSSPQRQRLVGLSWAGPDWLILDTNVTEDLTLYSNNVTLVSITRSLANNIRTRESAWLLIREAGLDLNLNLTDVVAYGLEFRKKGYGEFGGAMVDDVIDGAKHLIATRIADPARICTMGASYGGYSALMATLRDPTLFRCAIAVNAVTDPTTIIGERMKMVWISRRRLLGGLHRQSLPGQGRHRGELASAQRRALQRAGAASAWPG